MTTLTSAQPTVDAADIAREVERMVLEWMIADAAKRGEYRRSLARARDKWNSLAPAAQADPDNMRRNLIRSAVEIEVDRLDASARAAEQAEADRQAELQREWWERGQRALRDKERRQRVEDWILDNIKEDFRGPVDVAQMHKANPEAVRYILRDGVPLDVPDALVQDWKDDHEEGTDYGLNWFLFGDSGCGKTRLAAYLAMAHVRATEEPDSVVFWDFDQWTCLYRFAQQSREELAEYTRLIATTSLLVLDEFNRDFTAPQARGFLDLLKARFDRRQRLVVTCMFGLLECVETWDADPKLERWGSAIRRRLVDDAKMIPVCLDKEPK